MKMIAACAVGVVMGGMINHPLPASRAQVPGPVDPAVAYHTYVVNSERDLRVVQDVLAPYTGPAVFDSGQTVGGRTVGFVNMDLQKPTWQSEASLGFPSAAVTFEVPDPAQAAYDLAVRLRIRGANAVVRKDFDSTPAGPMSAVLSSSFNRGRWMVIFTKPMPPQ